MMGQASWSDIYASWYHGYVDTSPKSLEVAAQMKEYTLVEKGTWLAANPKIREEMMIFVSQHDPKHTRQSRKEVI
jgi:ABC-type tungstate transport system permease subunit